jgi:hypothetical protein
MLKSSVLVVQMLALQEGSEVGWMTKKIWRDTNQKVVWSRSTVTLFFDRISQH